MALRLLTCSPHDVKQAEAHCSDQRLIFECARQPSLRCTSAHFDNTSTGSTLRPEASEQGPQRCEIEN